MRSTASVGPVIPRQVCKSLDGHFLEAVVIEVWKQQLGRRLHRMMSTRPAPAPDLAVSASVPFDTGVPFVTVLSVPTPVAAAVATARLDLHEHEIAPGDIDDAFTELIAAVAVGIGRVLPDVTRMGPPLVVQGARLSTAVSSAQLDCGACLLDSAGPVYASVWRPRAPWRPAPRVAGG